MIRSTLLLILICSFLLLSCSHEPGPEKLGVFAETGTGFVELTSFGEQNGIQTYNLETAPPPIVGGTVKSYLINLPDVKIANSKVFWTSTLDKFFDEKNARIIGSSLESASDNNRYKISITDGNIPQSGYALLKVGMPLGTPDRMYIVQIGN